MQSRQNVIAPNLKKVTIGKEERTRRLPEWEVSEDKKPFCSIFNFDTSRNDFDFHLDFARRRRRRQT